MWIPKNTQSKYVAIPWNELPPWLSVQLQDFEPIANRVGEPVSFKPSSAKSYALFCQEEFPFFVGVKGQLNSFFTKQMWAGYTYPHGPTGSNWWKQCDIPRAPAIFLGMWLVFADDGFVVNAKYNIYKIIKNNPFTGNEGLIYFNLVFVPVVAKFMNDDGLFYLKQMVPLFWLSQTYDEALFTGIETDTYLTQQIRKMQPDKPFEFCEWDFPVNSGT